MKLISYKHLLIGVVMLAATGLAVAMKPSQKVADQGSQFSLETIIPQQFGNWKMEHTIANLVSPDVQAEIDKIYNQTLTRTYANGQGDEIMLSIAYGGDQSDSMAVHLPEGCYRGQGFDVKRSTPQVLKFGNAEVPVMRLIAEKGSRIEPITYWILVGESFAHNRTDRKLAQLRYTLTGKVPEGILVRISNINPKSEESFGLHQQFLQQMLSGMTPESRARLIGHAS